MDICENCVCLNLHMDGKNKIKQNKDLGEESENTTTEQEWHMNNQALHWISMGHSLSGSKGV